MFKQNESETRARAVTIRTEDGRRLAGSHFAPPHEPIAAVLICSSTATPRYLYEGFARHLTERGFAALTFDYQGVGGSRTVPLRRDRATKRTWGRLDMPAALERLEREHPGVPLYLVGHSVGGQMMGLMPNRGALRAVATVGTGYGYWGGMPRPFKYFVAAMWYAVVPIAAAVLGYTPTRAFGYGEDLPAGVGLDWARWGRRADYFAEEFRDELGFGELDVPWLALLAEDDPIATGPNAEALLALYPKAQITQRTLVPSRYDLEAIGHIQLFLLAMRSALAGDLRLAARPAAVSDF